MFNMVFGPTSMVMSLVSSVNFCALLIEVKCINSNKQRAFARDIQFHLYVLVGRIGHFVLFKF